MGTPARPSSRGCSSNEKPFGNKIFDASLRLTAAACRQNGGTRHASAFSRAPGTKYTPARLSLPAGYPARVHANALNKRLELQGCVSVQILHSCSSKSAHPRRSAAATQVLQQARHVYSSSVRERFVSGDSCRSSVCFLAGAKERSEIIIEFFLQPANITLPPTKIRCLGAASS